MKKTEDGKVLWINCAKFLAICAVLMDHMKGIVYQSENLQYISFFSVSAFMFLSGMTSFYSLRNHRGDLPWRSWVARRLGRILVPYLVAAAVCHFIMNGGSLDAVKYISGVLRFDLDGQFYFVLIYLQLIAAAPAVYLAVKAIGRSGWKTVGRLLLLAGMWIVSGFCIENTFILDVYGGGQHLFGGTYLFLFVLGMVAADIDPVLRSGKQAAAAFAGSLLAAAVTAVFMLKNRFAVDFAVFSYDVKVSPPGVTLIIYSLCVVALIYSFCCVVDRLEIRPLEWLLHAMNRLGRYTLYIFLYHMIILEVVLKHGEVLKECGTLIQVPLYMLVMIALPVLGKWCYAHIRSRLVRLERIS